MVDREIETLDGGRGHEARPAQPEQELTPEKEAIKHQIRRLRKNGGMSLQDLARRANVSVGLLSQIERGLSSPSLRTLTKIRVALEVPMTALFAPPDCADENEAPYVVRRENRRVVDVRQGKLTKELLSPASYLYIQSMLLVIPPGGGSGVEPYTGAGEKAGLVLEGYFRLAIEGTIFDLKPGDSFQFDGSKPHRFENRHHEMARVLWIISEPGRQTATS